MEDVVVGDLIDVFKKCILLKKFNENDDLPHLEDVADIESFGRYLKWSLASPELAEKVLSLQPKGDIHGAISWNNVLLLAEPYIQNKKDYNTLIDLVGKPEHNLAASVLNDENLPHLIYKSKFAEYVNTGEDTSTEHDENYQPHQNVNSSNVPNAFDKRHIQQTKQRPITYSADNVLGNSNQKSSYNMNNAPHPKRGTPITERYSQQLDDNNNNNNDDDDDESPSDEIQKLEALAAAKSESNTEKIKAAIDEIDKILETKSSSSLSKSLHSTPSAPPPPITTVDDLPKSSLRQIVASSSFSSPSPSSSSSLQRQQEQQLRQSSRSAMTAGNEAAVVVAADTEAGDVLEEIDLSSPTNSELIRRSQQQQLQRSQSQRQSQSSSKLYVDTRNTPTATATTKASDTIDSTAVPVASPVLKTSLSEQNSPVLSTSTTPAKSGILGSFMKAARGFSASLSRSRSSSMQSAGGELKSLQSPMRRSTGDSVDDRGSNSNSSSSSHALAPTQSHDFIDGNNHSSSNASRRDLTKSLDTGIAQSQSRSQSHLKDQNKQLSFQHIKPSQLNIDTQDSVNESADDVNDINDASSAVSASSRPLTREEKERLISLSRVNDNVKRSPAHSPTRSSIMTRQSSASSVYSSAVEVDTAQQAIDPITSTSSKVTTPTINIDDKEILLPKLDHRFDESTAATNLSPMQLLTRSQSMPLSSHSQSQGPVHAQSSMQLSQTHFLKPPKPDMSSATTRSMSDLTSHNLQHHNNTSTRLAASTNSTILPLKDMRGNFITTDHKHEVGSTRSQSSKGSNQSFLSTASNKIITMFGGRSNNLGTGQLVKSLSSFNANRNNKTEDTVADDENRIDMMGRTASGTRLFRRNGRGLGLLIRKEVGEALGLPNFINHPYANDITQLRKSVSLLSNTAGTGSGSGSTPTSPSASTDFTGKHTHAHARLGDSTHVTVTTAQLTFEALLQRVEKTSIVNNKDLAPEVLSYFNLFKVPATTFSQDDYINPADAVNEEKEQAELKALEAIQQPGSWSYYYHRKEPLCMSAASIRSRRKWLLDPRYLQRLIPSRSSLVGLQQAMLFTPRTHAHADHMSVNADGTVVVPVNPLTLITGRGALTQNNQPLARGGLPLPEIYSLINAMSMSDFPQEPPTLFDLQTGVSFRGIVQRKTTRGVFTSRNLLLYGCNMTPTPSSRRDHGSASSEEEIISPRIIIYERQLECAWGQVPIHLKSCILASDVKDVQWSEGNKSLFMLLASNYLKTAEAPKAATMGNIMRDEDIQPLTPAATGAGTKSAGNDANVSLLFSVESPQVRVAWTQWILLAKQFHSEKVQRLDDHRRRNLRFDISPVSPSVPSDIAYTDGGGPGDIDDLTPGDGGSEVHSELGTIGSNTMTSSRLDSASAHVTPTATGATGGRKYRARNVNAGADPTSTRHGRVY